MEEAKMALIRRAGFSDFEKAEIWRGWKRGMTLNSIGRALDRAGPHVRDLVAASGGIAPLPRRRSSWVLSRSEREEISRGIAAGHSMRTIATALERAASTVSREIARHGGRETYRADAADKAAWISARRPKRCRLAINGRLRRIVVKKLQLNWAPEQISGWLKEAYPEALEMQISHETIYRSLFIQARGVLKKELQGHLRTRRTIRRSRHASLRRQSRGKIIDAISISERPAEIEDRAIPGHWEGDLIAGLYNSHIATLVERQSRYVMLVKVADKSTPAVVQALIKQVRRLPKELKKSLTWDRGLEMAHHKDFSIATQMDVYFCDPRSPWQRGTNENTNRLTRQYLPKRTDLSEYSQADLNKIALQLNQRPRKTPGFRCPANKFGECVALTA
jgi:IS30 family transposase